MMSVKLLVVLAIVASFVFVEVNAQTSESTSQYVLRVRSEPNVLFISGGGLYDKGTSVPLSEAPESWREYTFIGWKIDGIWTDENPPTIRMDRNHEALAVYEKSESGKILVDTIPRITEITIDGTIYLPEELPVSFDWETNSDHIITVPNTVKQSPTTRFVFDSWKDKNPSNSINVIVNSDDSEYTALFKTQHFLKPISQYGDVLGGGWQNEGSTVSFEVESDIVIDKKNENIRYVFDSWNLGDYPNSASNLIDVEDPITVKAKWDKQYQLQLQTNVPGYDLFGTGWYDGGRQVALIAEEELESPNSDIRYAFDRWVSRGPNPVIIPNAHLPSTTITVNEPFVIEAQYAKSFRVNVWTQYGSVEGDGFYKQGEVATIKIISSEVVVQPNKIRKVFTGWETHGSKKLNLGDNTDIDLADVGAVGNSNLLLYVDRSTNVTTNWKTQYYLDVQSSEASAKGSGWYDLGRMVPISVSTPNTPPGLWSAHKFDKWVGDIDSTNVKDRIIMNGPKTVIAEWREDNTPGIINSIILGGIAVIAVIVFSKTRKNNLLNLGKKNSKTPETNAFEKFFSTSKRRSESASNTPSFMPKQDKKKAIIDWLLGR